MAWRCSASSNELLVMNLKVSRMLARNTFNMDKRANIIHSEDVAEAMRAVDRGNYAPSDAYQDSPMPIGYGQTISAPHMHAYALEHLRSAISHPDAHVLDVGCGSGYFAVLCARLNPSATVYAIDIVPELVTLSINNANKAEGRVRFKVANGWEGLKDEHGHTLQFDAIHVGAAAESIPPGLLRQLKVGGRMVIPVGPEYGNQELVQVDRKGAGENPDKDYTIKHLMGVRYVPLVKSRSGSSH